MLKDQLTEDMKSALKAGEKEKLTTIRLVIAAVKNLETEDRSKTITDDDVLTLIRREIKQSQESLEEYGKGSGYEAKIAELQNRITTLNAYLPKQLTQDELETIVKETIAEVGATAKSDTGKVMAALMPKVKGLAEGKVVNQTVGKLLG